MIRKSVQQIGRSVGGAPDFRNRGPGFENPRWAPDGVVG